ncbi:hypothetical protein [Hymenobacter sp. DG01]|uniref:hypothetical protein n=1 Tax=Hymenobacter sp. DG01 TaxID=2584940 RepID=UPI00111D30A2|nr:hypothetical protein [Hymenobacter sp. DG01]
MGALQLASFLTETLHTPQMSVVPTATPSLGACCMLVAADLYRRRGAAVSANVLTEQVSEEELGEVISIDHAPQRRAKRYNETTDQALVALLLLKVQESHPAAKMKWNDEETSWYISVPKPRTPALKLSAPRTLKAVNWIS